MSDEIKALKRNHTWNIVDLPARKKPIGCKWVYKIKQKFDVGIERYKAWLVAKGYTQRKGIDFLDTYSPVAKLTTIRVILALAAIKDCFFKQLDVDNALLHGDLNEEVYMEVSPGVDTKKANQVCCLDKSLYGLKQASRQWYEKLTSHLFTIGFNQSKADHSLFIKKYEKSFISFYLR